MIDYQTYCQIHQLQDREGFKVNQIAREVQLDPKTVSHWLNQSTFQLPKRKARASILDPYKPQIIRWLETYPYTGRQIFQRLQDQGYRGGYTIVLDYVRTARPRRQPAFLSLEFAPGQCAQVDWGSYGAVHVGNTRRRLSFFVLVLASSRLMYVQFTLAETMEHFLDCHRQALEFLGGTPREIWVDNCKVAVLQRPVGQPPVLNPKYLDFANHYGFTIKPCGVRKPQEKGVVENAVGYVKKNFLAGLELSDFAAYNPAARHWLDQVANSRQHGQIKQPPRERFQAEEKSKLLALPQRPYDVGVIRERPLRVSRRFRVALDSNRYSVPARLVGQPLQLKVYPDRLCLYHQDQLVAEHPRCYDRGRDFENPDHVHQLLQQRRRAREQKLLIRFLGLSAKAPEYYEQLQARRFNAMHHVRLIVALSEIHPIEQVARALEDALELGAISSEYLTNLLEQRQRPSVEPPALQLTRRQDLLELELPQPDLSIYQSSREPSIDSSHEPSHEQ